MKKYIKIAILAILLILVFSIKSFAATNEKQTAKDTGMYTLPLINSSIIQVIDNGEKLTIYEQIVGWTRIEYDNTMGWVRTSNLQDITEQDIPTEETEEDEQNTQVDNNIDDLQAHNQNNTTTTNETVKKMYISVDTANVRKEPNTTSDIVTVLDLKDAVDTLGLEGDWYKVKVSGKTGYIRKDLLAASLSEITSRSTDRTQVTTATAPVINGDQANIGNSIADYALQFKGYNYVYGGASPSTGFDCSGLTSYVLKQFGCTIERRASLQWKQGTEIAKANLQRGDLVFFLDTSGDGSVGHVGIYIGNNEFIHASTSTTGVIISSLNQENYIRRWVGAKRMI